MSDEHIKDNRVVQIADLIPHPRNFRNHPDEQISDLVLSLQRFGQGRSIVIQDAPGKKLIVGGHGVVQAAQQIGWQEIRADVLPANWTSSQIEGYLVADNLHSQKSSDDETMLAQLLQSQQDAGFDLRSLGSDDESLRQMLESLGDGVLEDGDGDGKEEIPGINAPDLPYKNQFAVAVMCGSEEEQKTVFDALNEQGYTCKVLVV